LTAILIKKGRTEKPKGFLRWLVLMEQERHSMAVLGCAEGLYVRKGSWMLLEVSTGGRTSTEIIESSGRGKTE